MMNSIYDKVLAALQQAENHNSQVMVKPEVILWPDPERLWEEVIPVLQEALPHLLVYGAYSPQKRQGPAIWLKCMIARTLPEVNWNDHTIPVVYLPGVSKSDLRNVENAVFNFQPLLEYQYTGMLFMQENGREWTILAFLENPLWGLGVKVAKDNPTREALRKTLPYIFQDRDVLANKTIIDADYLNHLLFPDIIPTLLHWMCRGDSMLQKLTAEKKEAFYNLCKSQYEFEPDHKNIRAIAEKLGAQKNAWKYVWQMYATAPHKYPEIETLLRMAKPADLGFGMFTLPEESWPQVNEEKEEVLRLGLLKAAKLDAIKALTMLSALENDHAPRRNWVWSELGYSPLANALQYLVPMVTKTLEYYGSASVEILKTYYTTIGFRTDQYMRQALAAVRSEKDKEAVKHIIQLFYKPWLEQLAHKFQKLVAADAAVFLSQWPKEEEESFVLFVDALRYELGESFMQVMTKSGCQVHLQAEWSAIPSLTPTSKPACSPLASKVSQNSVCQEFRPQLNNGKDLTTQVFRDALPELGFQYIAGTAAIQTEGKYWQEIGELDTKGHQEQADVVRRIDEFFEQVKETILSAFEKGVKRIKIVTDHGWLLLPGGLPKTQLNAGLTETRWGRCALIKEGATVDLLHLPWRWNPSVYIAYPPGISFFKANQEYAHGGISLHECLVPVLIIEPSETSNMNAEIIRVKWVNLKCSIETTELPDGYRVDIRTKFSDEKTTIVDPVSRDKRLQKNAITLMVEDKYEYQSATIVLMDENGTILDKKPTTVGG